MTFVVFVQSSDENILTPQIAFVSLSLFATLQSIMGLLPPIVVWIAEVTKLINVTKSSKTKASATLTSFNF